MTPEQLTAMEQALADLNKHYPYEDESGIIKLSLGRFMNARETIRTAIEQAKRQQALDKMAENARELGLDYEPVQEQSRSEKLREAGFTRRPKAWSKDEEAEEPAAPVQESDAMTIAYMDGYDKGNAAAQPAYDQTALELCEVCGWKTLIPGDVCLNCEHEAAAQRQWVGLTDEEVNSCWDELMGRYDYSREMVYRAIEAKLREKNGG